MTAPPPRLLDWSDASLHWRQDAKPCRHCGGLTHLRTTKRSPAHKVCAEAALAEQQAEAIDQYLKGT